jgi:DnaJ family protein C protein 28
MGEPPRPARKGESAIEKQIREAIERGDFDRLPGTGKPLDLSENPYTPEDWRLAFKLLQDAGMAPAWIELDKEIRRELQGLDVWIKQQAQRQKFQHDRAIGLSTTEMIKARAHLAEACEKTCIEYRQRAAALNRLIDIYNLKAPRADLHRERIRLEEEIRKFRDACQ